jgi:hypothetical protein
MTDIPGILPAMPEHDRNELCRRCSQRRGEHRLADAACPGQRGGYRPYDRFDGSGVYRERLAAWKREETI